MKRITTILIKSMFLVLLFVGFMFTQIFPAQVDAMQKVTVESTSQSITSDIWESIVQKKIFFGHQSVGNNIIDGLRMVAIQNRFRALNIIETRKLKDIQGSMFVHSKVGKNKQPNNKIRDFVEIIRSGIGQNLDMAFLKLCYVDIGGNTNIKELFQHYHSTLHSLQKQNPSVAFLAVTCPLTTLQTGWKAWVKRALRRSPYGYQENMKRYEFNQLVRKAYTKNGLLFDIAQVESTLPDGRRSTYLVNNTRSYVIG